MPVKLTLFRSCRYTPATLALALFSLQLFAQPKPTAGSDRIKSLQARKELADKSLLKDVAFRNIGPSIMSGRVVDLEVNPADPTEIFVAYATGGLWHSTNNGQSFKPIFDAEATIGIGDIAVNWTTREIWLGSGEVNSSRSSYAGLGVYKSRDTGRTWTYLGLPESHHIGKVLLHPTDARTAWVAVLGALYSPNKQRGVYKTTDGGETWKHVLAIDEQTGAVEMDLNPQNPNELWASTWYRARSAWNFEEGGKTSGIHFSKDGGQTWALVSGPASGFPQGNGIGRIGVAVSASKPDIVYAIVDNYNAKPDTAKRDTSRIYLADLKGITKTQFAELKDQALDRFLRQNGLGSLYSAASLKRQVQHDSVKPSALYDFLYEEGAGPQPNQIFGAEVYRSDDKGQHWKKTHEKPLGLYSTFGYYFGKIFVSPVNPDKIIILGVSAEMSTDGGKNWTVMDKGNTHADWHAVWFNPNRDSHIVAGNDGGCNITYDNGKSWFKANTPAVGQFYAINVDNEKPYNVYGGLQDNGSWYGPSTTKESIDWIDAGVYPYKSLNGGDGMQVQIDPRDHRVVYSGLQFGSYFRINKEKGETKPIRPAVNSLEDPKLRFNWQTPILLSPHNPDILYYGANRLYRSFNKGDKFEPISPDLTGGRKVGDVPYGTLTTVSESPLAFGTIITGSDDGYVYLTKDGGASWNRLGMPDKKGLGGFPQGLYVSRVVASRHQKNRLYVTVNGYRNDHFAAYIYRSDDLGLTWKQLGTGLPMEPVNVLREDPKSDQVIYIGTDGGAWASVDGGNSFHAFTKGLPVSIPIHDIAIQERENEIVLGTHGRSLYVGRLDLVQAMLKK